MSKVSLTQTVLGHTFSVPFFIAPAANAGFSHPRGELNLVEAAGKAGILYAPALISTKRMEDIAAHAVPGQVVFHQVGCGSRHYARVRRGIS